MSMDPWSFREIPKALFWSKSDSACFQSQRQDFRILLTLDSLSIFCCGGEKRKAYVRKLNIGLLNEIALQIHTKDNSVQICLMWPSRLSLAFPGPSVLYQTGSFSHESCQLSCYRPRILRKSSEYDFKGIIATEDLHSIATGRQQQQ